MIKDSSIKIGWSQIYSLPPPNRNKQIHSNTSVPNIPNPSKIKQLKHCHFRIYFFIYQYKKNHMGLGLISSLNLKDISPRKIPEFKLETVRERGRGE